MFKTIATQSHCEEGEARRGNLVFHTIGERDCFVGQREDNILLAMTGALLKLICYLLTGLWIGKNGIATQPQ